MILLLAVRRFGSAGGVRAVLLSWTYFAKGPFCETVRGARAQFEASAGYEALDIFSRT
jgi:hypothetical protein